MITAATEYVTREEKASNAPPSDAKLSKRLRLLIWLGTPLALWGGIALVAYYLLK